MKKMLGDFCYASSLVERFVWSVGFPLLVEFFYLARATGTRNLTSRTLRKHCRLRLKTSKRSTKKKRRLKLEVTWTKFSKRAFQGSEGLPQRIHEVGLAGALLGIYNGIALSSLQNVVENSEEVPNCLGCEQEKMNASLSYHKSQSEQLRTDIAALKNQENFTRQALEAKKRVLAAAHNQVDAHTAGISSRQLRWRLS